MQKSPTIGDFWTRGNRGGMVAGLTFLILATAYVVYQQLTAPYRQATGKIFGTFYNITYQSPDNLDSGILKALESVDASLSMFNQESTIARINRAEDIPMDNHLAYLLPRALKISEQTDGAFDVTVAPLVNAWGFGFKNDALPTDAVVDSLRQFVGYKLLHINDKRIQKDDPRTMFDLSAIAKGYGVDVVARLLDNAKVKNYMVEIGGEVVVKGENEKGGEWRIGIAKPKVTPDDDTRSYAYVLKLTDCAIATSGNYRNFYEKDGRRYAHTIDPRTGRPVQMDIVSATVVAKNCYEADAYATAFMVVGLEKAKAILESNPNLSAHLIYINARGEQESWSKGL